MANSRANSTGWIFGEILTETQANHMDEGQARAVDGRSGQLQIETHSVTRLAEDQPIWRPAFDAHIVLVVPWVVATSSLSTSNFYWPLKVPSGAIITGWSLTVQGNSHTDPPAIMPSARILSSAGSGGVISDPSVFASDYNLPHTISETGLNLVIDNSVGGAMSHGVYLEITTESGANSKIGTRFAKASVTFLVSKLDEG